MRNRFTSVRNLYSALFVALLPLFASMADELVISTPAEIHGDLESVVCKSTDRESAVVRLFEKMGASSEEITIEKPGGVHNIVLRKAGSSDETIIVGAHYDKVLRGCGAIDNWTGIVVLANIYRSLRSVPTQKSLEFVAFGREEEGLLGSKAMVGKMSKDQIARTCAMVDLDSFGMGAVQAATNLSSSKLVDLASTLAKQSKIPFGHSSLPGADGDSTPFRDRKIPAILLHGLTLDWPGTLHSERDQLKAVKPEGVYSGYRLALLMVVEIDQAPLDKWR